MIYVRFTSTEGMTDYKFKRMKPLNPDYEERVRDSFNRQGLINFMGGKITEIKPGYLEIQLPFKQELT